VVVGGLVSVLVGAVVVVVVAVVVAVVDGEVSPVEAVAAMTISAITATTLTMYDNVSPTIARSRPAWPRYRICESATCPSTIPTGANTKANTTDSVARGLTAAGGRPYGDGGTP
jgi:hypothetical protein